MAQASLSLRPPSQADITAKRAARKVLEEDRAHLMIEQPFIGLLAMQLEITPAVDCRLLTAATDGRAVFVNPYFLDTLTPSQRVFLLAHEVWHCALMHILRQGDRKREPWDLAIDHEVNCLLEECGFDLPSGSALIRDKDGKNAEEIYAYLLPLALQSSDAVRKRVFGRGEMSDQHLDELEQVCQKSEGVIDPDYSPFVDRKTLHAWRGKVISAAQQVERGRGTLPGSIKQLVTGYRTASIPWQEVLRQFIIRSIGEKRRWLPPNRRYISQGLYLPSRRTERLTISVAIDTSGSTIGLLPDFLGELIVIANSFGDYELEVIQCDASIQSIDVYDQDHPLSPDRVPFSGLGGTDFRPVFSHLHNKGSCPNLLVFFTDGLGPAPTNPPDFPVLWVLPAGFPAPAEWGELLTIPGE